MARKSCRARNRRGEPCKAPAKPNGFCAAHDPEVPVAKRFGTIEQANAAGRQGGRPRRPREIDLIEQVAEEKRVQLRAVYTDGLIADRGVVVGNGPSAHIEFIPDHPHRLATAKEILDRLHGRPTTNGEIHNGHAVVNINLITDDALRRSAAELRRDLAAQRTVEPRRLGAGG